jgi:flagellar biosynthesis protein FlhA
MKLAEVQQALHGLLREQVSIRQLAPILETLGEYAPRTKDPVLLVEYVRHRLARSISTRYRAKDGKLYVATLDPALEDRIRAGIEHTDRGLFVRLSPPMIDSICRLIAADTERLSNAGHSPVLLVSPQIRPGLRQITSAQLPRLVVLSYNEITRDTRIEAVAVVSDVK